jgi:TonB-dependent siderophore receptor
MDLVAWFFPALLLLPQTQSAPPDDDPPAVAETITVVGYRELYAADASSSAIRAEVPLVELPQSVGVIGEKILEDQGVTNISEAARNVAGLTAVSDSVNSSNLFTLRGYLAPNFRDGFRVGLSDVPKRSGAAPPIDPLAIDTIEVVRGPSAIMFGRGNPGGIVNLVSKRPEFDRSTQVGLATGRFEKARGEFDTTGPITEQLAYRLLASYTHRDSYRNEVESTAWFLHPALTWAGSRWSLHVAGELNDFDTTPEEGVLLLPNPAHDTIPAPFSTRENYYGSNVNRFETRSHRGQLELGGIVNPDWNVRLQLFAERQTQDGRHVFGQFYNFNGALRVLGFPANSANHDVRADDVFTNTRTDRAIRVESSNHFQHTFGATPVDHELLTSLEAAEGGFATRGRTVPLDFFSPVNGAAFTHVSLSNPLFPNDRVGTRDFDDRAIVVQDFMRIGDRVSLLAGLRYENAKVDALNTNTSRLLPFSAAIKLSDNELVPRVGVHYAATTNVHLWTSYSESYTPSLGQTTSAGEPVEPESGAQTELGARVSLLGGKLDLSSSLYEIRKTDVIITDPANPLAAINGGRELARGAELEAFGSIGNSLRFTGNVAYIDQKFTSHPRLRGKTRYGVPDWSANLWGAYDAPNGISLGAGVAYRDGVWNDDTNSVFLPSSTTVDAMVAYRVSDDWRVQMNLKNLTDELSYTPLNRGDANDPTVPVFAMPTAPREVNLRVEYRF